MKLGEQWISVKDRLPETEDEVLVLTVSKTGNVNVDKGYLLNGRFVHRGSAVITHWMPLPEPPEGYTLSLGKIDRPGDE